MPYIYALVLFSSAFLSFQIQPLIGKLLLPWFGGGAGVWSICLLFFQSFLLLGYLYAHLMSKGLRLKAQSYLHGVLLLAAVLVLGIVPNPAWKPATSEQPTLQIFSVLTLSVGFPYFLLTATTPLLQSWYKQAHLGAPYWLYSLSNLGSMLGLLSYPFLVEPLFGLKTQALIWSAGFVGFSLLCALVGLYSAARSGGPERAALRTDARGAEGEARRPAAPAPRESRLRTSLIWMTLATVPSILLLASTNHLCLDVASIPFLWVLPLSLYLLSFIICFARPDWYRPRLYCLVTILMLLWAAWALSQAPSALGLGFQIALYSAVLFAVCMLCHGELVRRRPTTGDITAFYLAIAAGGVVGGASVAVMAPLVFKSYLEFRIILGVAFVVAVLFFARQSSPAEPRWRRKPRRKSADAREALGWERNVITVGVLVIGIAIVLVWLLAVGDATLQGQLVEIDRDFYGVVQVRELIRDSSGERAHMMHNGRILHGAQVLNEGLRREPLLYFHPSSGVGWAFQAQQSSGRPLRVGVVGLGAGTLAAFGRTGDYFRFYEISPIVARMAGQHFTYLSDTPAKVDVVIGDARLSLERDEPQNFDLLVLDAFTGDAIPLHLLTLEAFESYRRHLHPDGVIVTHISNVHLDLATPMHSLATRLGSADARIVTLGDDSRGWLQARWHLLSQNRDLIARAVSEARAETGAPGDRDLLWTDDYSNLFHALR